MSNFIEIKNDSLTVSINTFGAELSSIKKSDGKEFLWHGDPNVWAGRAPVLFPFCGALKNGSYRHEAREYTIEKHGFARRCEFKAELLSSSKAVFTLKADEKTLELYPFDFVLAITYELEENNLKVTYNVKNPSNEKLYFSIGSHEAYACPEGISEYCVAFDEEQSFNSCTLEGPILDNKSTKVAESGKIIDLYDQLFENDALIFKNVPYDKVYLVNKSGDRKITVSFPGFKNLLIWTKPGAKYLCLEPWTGLPDNVDSSGILSEKEDITILNENSEYSVVHTITFEG